MVGSKFKLQDLIALAAWLTSYKIIWNTTVKTEIFFIITET